MTIGLKKLTTIGSFFQTLFDEGASSGKFQGFSYDENFPAFDQIAQEEDVDIVIEDNPTDFVNVKILAKSGAVGKAIYKKYL